MVKLINTQPTPFIQQFRHLQQKNSFITWSSCVHFYPYSLIYSEPIFYAPYACGSIAPTPLFNWSVVFLWDQPPYALLWSLPLHWHSQVTILKENPTQLRQKSINIYHVKSWIWFFLAHCAYLDLHQNEFWKTSFPPYQIDAMGHSKIGPKSQVYFLYSIELQKNALHT